MSLAMHKVDNSREYHDCDPNQRSPVGIPQVNGQESRKAAEDDYERRVNECESIDVDAKTTEAPACGWKCFPFDPF